MEHYRPFGADHAFNTLSWVAFRLHGVVGVAIKSHQDSPPRYPTEALAQSNAKVDRWCTLARPCPSPADVRIPSSPLFAFVCYMGMHAHGRPRAGHTPAPSHTGHDQAQSDTGPREIRHGQQIFGPTYAGTCPAVLGLSALRMADILPPTGLPRGY